MFFIIQIDIIIIIIIIIVVYIYFGRLKILIVMDFALEKSKCMMMCQDRPYLSIVYDTLLDGDRNRHIIFNL